MNDYPPTNERHIDDIKHIAELEAKVAEHEKRWDWLTKSFQAISDEGYATWASPTLAVTNKCRYEKLEVTK